MNNVRQGQLNDVRAVSSDPDALAELRTVATALINVIERLDRLSASVNALNQWVIQSADLNGVAFAPPISGTPTL